MTNTKISLKNVKKRLDLNKLKPKAVLFIRDVGDNAFFSSGESWRIIETFIDTLTTSLFANITTARARNSFIPIFASIIQECAQLTYTHTYDGIEYPPINSTPSPHISFLSAFPIHSKWICRLNSFFSVRFLFAFACVRPSLDGTHLWVFNVLFASHEPNDAIYWFI